MQVLTLHFKATARLHEVEQTQFIAIYASIHKARVTDVVVHCGFLIDVYTEFVTLFVPP